MHDHTRLGPFAVDQQIGEGGMGAVYRGTHRETGVPVAIKVIHREAGGGARDRFHEEVQAHAGLLHPGVVYLFEYGEVDEAAAGGGSDLEEGSPFVAMELADRGTVRDAMPVGRWETVCRLLVQILDALAYAHARGVVHRDLKPENFLLFDGSDEASGWRVKLADFGIAHAFSREREAGTTQLEVAAGTPLYMAPEQLYGNWRQFGPWTDLYALGCIAYELVCGRPPFDGETALSIARRHESEPPPPLEPRFPLPDGVEPWIQRAMSADPDRRFQRAADAAWALPRGVLGESTAGASDRTEPSTPGPEELQSGETRDERLTSTLLLEETETLSSDTVGDEASSIEQATTRAAEADGKAGSDAETKAPEAVDVCAASGEPSKSPAHHLLEHLRPPVPDDWRPEHTDPIPAPLVGAGLGLFGLREPPFVDRRESCDAIWGALQRVVERGGCEAVFVAGEAGTGKSRLAEWMTTRAHEVGAARIVRAVHTPEGGASEGLRGALERTLRTLKMDRGEVYEHLLETVRAARRDDDGLVDQDARALTEYLRPTDEDADTIDGPRFRFANARQKRAVLVRTLGRLADQRPLVLWLDDLQWGPEAVGVLEYLQERRSDPSEMLILATVRSDVVAERPRLAERLEPLREMDGATSLELEPLSREYQRELLDGLLPLEDDLADRLAERTEGHPLFAMQLLGHWIERRDLRVGAKGFGMAEGRELELPADIHQLWIERIDRLRERFDRQADQVLEVLGLAAALGRQVNLEEWVGLLADADLPRPAGLVDRLVERGLAERTADGWAFAHRLLVDSLARRSREAGRWSGHHRRCARMLEARLTGEETGPRERIAEHWVAGGRAERALEPLLEESELYLRRGNATKHRSVLERCGELLERLEIADDDPRRLEHQIRRAHIMGREDDVQQARTELQAVWEQLGDDQPRLRARCAYFLAVMSSFDDDRQEARRWAEPALEAARQVELPRVEARCHSRVGWTWLYDGELAEAERHIEKSIEAAEQGNHHYEKLNGLRSRARIQLARDAEAAGELWERVQREAAAAGYLVIEAVTLNDLGEEARFGGRFSEARQYYRRYLTLVRQLSRPVLELLARLNLGQIALRTGALDRSAEHLREAEELLETVGARDRRDIVHLLHLGHAAGTEDRSRFADRWAPLTDGWPEDWRLIYDHPWLLETIGEYAREAGWEEQAREVWRLAAELWEELGDEEAAERLRGRVER